VPNFLPRACEERGGCPNRALPGRRKCSIHDDSRERDNLRRRDDPTKSKYNSAAWRRTSDTVRKHNPMCQKLDEHRQQCRYPATLVHHVHGSMTRPDLFYAIYDTEGRSNLVALCLHCHPPTEGTEDWQEGRDFVRTAYRMAMLG